jgi:hypothetical protein
MKTIVICIAVGVSIVLSGCAAAAIPLAVAPVAAIPAITIETVAVTVALVASSSESAWQDTVVLDAQHAIDRHGIESYQAIQDCLKSNGAMMILRHSINGRVAKVCRVDAGRYGIEIDEPDGTFKTSFIPKWYDTFYKVIQYLEQGRYQPVQ